MGGALHAWHCSCGIPRCTHVVTEASESQIIAGVGGAQQEQCSGCHVKVMPTLLYFWSGDDITSHDGKCLLCGRVPPFLFPACSQIWHPAG